MTAHRSLIVFDLDGTLIDSLADIAGAMNEMLRARGLAERSLEEMRSCVGEGAWVAVDRATSGRFSGDHKQLDALVGEYLKIYRRRGSPSSAPYAGITDALAEFSRQRRDGSLAIAILTNKPHEIALDAVAKHLGKFTFDGLEGVRPCTPRKPDATGLLRLMKKCGAAPGTTVMVGDTRVDIETGKAAGAGTIGCAWGFRPAEEMRSAGADEIAQTPSELPSLCRSVLLKPTTGT